jgi:hypothetical protein
MTNAARVAFFVLLLAMFVGISFGVSLAVVEWREDDDKDSLASIEASLESLPGDGDLDKIKARLDALELSALSSDAELEMQRCTALLEAIGSTPEPTAFISLLLGGNHTPDDVAMGYSDTHWDWTSNLQGDIVGMGGHVHDFGISVAAQNLNQTATAQAPTENT